MRWLFDALVSNETMLVVSYNDVKSEGQLVKSFKHIQGVEFSVGKRFRFLWYVDDFTLFDPLKVILRREFLTED
jgi:hypothetical protein